jgi:quercetin dioxygenase-like cupin family protein
MHVFDTAALEMETVGQADDTSARWRGAFPFSSDRPGETVGNSSEYTVVYNELEPEAEIGTHTDSVDELVLITDGTVEATVDGTTTTASDGELAVVPAGVPHSVRNVGTDTASLVGYFAAGTVESAFEGDPPGPVEDEE